MNRADTDPVAAAAIAAAREELVTILRLVCDEYPLDAALDDAAQRGLHFSLTPWNPTTGYASVWEHPFVTAHNLALEPHAAARDTLFFTLFEIRPECRRQADTVPWVFVAGRSGDTVNYEIRVQR